MANYNVGNIEIGILSKNNNSLDEIDQTIAKLQKFKAIDKDLQNVFSSINKLSNGFKKLANFKVNDFDSIETNFSKINSAVDPFLKNIKQSETSLVALAKVLGNLKVTNITRASSELKKLGNKAEEAHDKIKKIDLSTIFNRGKMIYFFNISKRYFLAIRNMLLSAVNFNETLNKFQVSMGSYYDKSLKFVNDITKAFNISTESIMDYMSTFKNMLSALGNLSEDTSYQLSETLTRMALDYASLFNVEVTKAMNQFQAVLSGQINKPCLARKGLREKLTTLINGKSKRQLYSWA